MSQYADPACTMLWMRQLQYAPVQVVTRVLAVIPKALEDHNKEKEKPQQSGGMQVVFSGQEYTQVRWSAFGVMQISGRKVLPGWMREREHISRQRSF